MKWFPYLFLVPVLFCLGLIPDATRKALSPSLSIGVPAQAAVGWTLFFFVWLGISKRWRATRPLIAVTFLYLFALEIYGFWFGGEGVVSFVTGLAAYGLAAWLPLALAPPFRRVETPERDLSREP